MPDEALNEVVQSGKAERYSPAQFNLFTGAAELIPIEVAEPVEDDREIRVDEGISLVKTEDGSQLILSGFGLFLSKKSERLLVRKGKQVIYQFPFFRLNEVVVGSKGITVSSDLLEEMCLRGIRLSFLDRSGKPYAMVTLPDAHGNGSSPARANTGLTDKRGLEFCKAVVLGKIKNQERLLRYFGEAYQKEAEERFVRIEETAAQLESALEEGAGHRRGLRQRSQRNAHGNGRHGGRIYWNAVQEIIGHRVEFFGREHRARPMGEFAARTHGYGFFTPRSGERCLTRGLEPFAGFLHVDRPGKPSLVLIWSKSFASQLSIGQ